MYVIPAVDEAIQRRVGSACASSPAHSAALIAARFTTWPPSAAPATVPAPVSTRTERTGTL